MKSEQELEQIISKFSDEVLRKEIEKSQKRSAHIQDTVNELVDKLTIFNAELMEHKRSAPILNSELTKRDMAKNPAKYGLGFRG